MTTAKRFSLYDRASDTYCTNSCSVPVLGHLEFVKAEAGPTMIRFWRTLDDAKDGLISAIKFAKNPRYFNGAVSDSVYDVERLLS